MIPKAQATKEKRGKLDLIEIKNFFASKETIEDNPQNWRKNPQITYRIRNLYLEYMKNYYTSTIKRQSNLKMGKGYEQTFLQRRYINDQNAHEKMLKILSC